jgi:hypothetical protein
MRLRLSLVVLAYVTLQRSLRLVQEVFSFARKALRKMGDSQSKYLLTRGARGSSFPKCEAPSVGKSFTPADLTRSPEAAK